MEINQIVPSLNYGDAIGNHAAHIRETLVKMGYDSYIYAEGCHPKFKDIYRHYTEYKNHCSSKNILIYHHCIGGTRAFEYFTTVPDIKIIIYHNITPSHFFREFSPELHRLTEQGRKELLILKNLVYKAISVSEYNCQELQEAGFRDIAVLPLPVYMDKFESQKPNDNILEFYDDDYTNIIFVGRISPNKRQDDLIKIFNYYSKNFNSDSRLILVGSYSGMENYCHFLLRLAGDLKLRNVVLTGHTSFDELTAYYKLGHVFLCMSEHEGFCVPLLESMYFNIPIIAFNSSVIPYTLGNAGILINEKREDVVSGLVDLTIRDSELRTKIIETQSQRLEYFKIDRTEDVLKDCLSGIAN